MTAYEQGFFTKCAEAGVPYEVADFMYKMAAPPANWRAQRPTRSMTEVSVANGGGSGTGTYSPQPPGGAVRRPAAPAAGGGMAGSPGTGGAPAGQIGASGSVYTQAQQQQGQPVRTFDRVGQSVQNAGTAVATGVGQAVAGVGNGVLDAARAVRRGIGNQFKRGF